MSTFHGIVPNHRVECEDCGGSGVVIVGAGAGLAGKCRKCHTCDGEGRVEQDLTTEERLERIEDYLGIGLLLKVAS